MSHHIVPAAEAYLDRKIPVLDHGFVILVDYMGSDAAVAEAARCSVAGGGVKTTSDDRGLIRRLMSDLHTSPFEMVEFKFLCAMPIFVARQWIRHRTANVNEMSGRYSELPELTYVPEPEQVAWQHPTNKQGRKEVVPPQIGQAYIESIRRDAAHAFESYHTYLGTQPSPQDVFSSGEYPLVRENGGISRELARINLPLSTYTQWYWKIDLHNLLHFLFLRLDEHAQWEIRQYAEVMSKVVQAACPVTWEAFEDYRLHAERLSYVEITALQDLAFKYREGKPPVMADHVVSRFSKRELEAFQAKLRILGLGFLQES